MAADDDDDHPRPPAGGAMHDELCVAIGVADAEPSRFRFDEGQREAFVAAMGVEVVRGWSDG